VLNCQDVAIYNEQTSCLRISMVPSIITPVGVMILIGVMILEIV